MVILLVMTFCWWLWSPPPRVAEVYKPEVKQTDGSVILEKKPDAQAKPKQILPPGAKVDRIASVTVQPRAVQHVRPAVATQGGTDATAQPELPAAQAPAAPCPPITVDLSLVTMPDKSKRVVASSPDGEVISGVDIPVENADPPPAPKLWATGAVIDPFRRIFGAFVDRDIGFLRVGLQLNQRNEGELPTQAWVKAGIRF